ncbi:MAG: cache domain-containing protein, partial [Pseudomonadota bacterium]|nr:cache domain-containing protein [Pseudomonadota bacterium]
NQRLHDRIKSRVEDACKISHSLHDRFSASHSEEEVQQMILSALRPLVWNGGESFIWILDYDGVFQLAPEYLRHLEGTSIIDFKDATGREVIKEEIELVQTQEEGFLWDTFTKPGGEPGKQYEQLAYVKNFGFYNWYLGSSEYLDTANKVTDEQLLQAISKIDQAGEDSLFIFRGNGDLLLSAAYPNKVGQNLSLTRPVESLEEGESAFKYEWLNEISRPNEAKHVYVKGVKDSDWIIGSVFYDADLRLELDQTKTSLVEQHEQRIYNMKNVSVLSVLVAILISLFLSVTVHRMLARFQEQVAQKNRELNVLNVSLEEKVRKRTSELELANSQLELLATTDSLTGIQNRYAFMKVIDSEIKRSDRYRSHFSLITFDIDFFKEVNDKFGHDVGDSVLIELTRLVAKTLRDVDAFCRLGGEEFIILLPCTSLDVACQIAERLRVEVAEYQFTRIKSLTISLGVVEHLQDEEVDAVLKRADVALYKSKDNGRNQVTMLES